MRSQPSRARVRAGRGLSSRCCAQRSDERLERALIVDGLVCPVGIDALELDVEVAHRPEPSSDIAEAVAIRLRPALAERLAEDAPGRALAAGRHPHLVDVLDVLAVADPGLAVEHAGEVEAHDLATRLGDGVLGEDARSLARRRAAARPCRPRRRVSGSLGLVTPRRRACADRRGGASASGSSSHPAEPSSAASAASSLLVPARCSPLSVSIAAPRAGKLRSIALGQLGFELDEPVDDAAACHDVDLVEAQLDAGRGRPQLAHAAELTDRHRVRRAARRRHARGPAPGHPRPASRSVARRGRPAPRALPALEAAVRARRCGRAT